MKNQIMDGTGELIWKDDNEFEVGKSPKDEFPVMSACDSTACGN
jgi:hypothetical protein